MVAVAKSVVCSADTIQLIAVASAAAVIYCNYGCTYICCCCCCCRVFFFFYFLLSSLSFCGCCRFFCIFCMFFFFSLLFLLLPPLVQQYWPCGHVSTAAAFLSLHIVLVLLQATARCIGLALDWQSLLLLHVHPAKRPLCPHATCYMLHATLAAPTNDSFQHSRLGFR